MGNRKVVEVLSWILVFIGFGIPLNILFIYTFKNPKGSINWGRRISYKNEEDLEPTEFTVDRLKFGSILGIILINLIFINWLIQVIKM